MAKRYPLSRASKEYEHLADLYPWLPKLIAPYPEMQTGDKSCLEMSRGIPEVCSSKTGIPIQMALAAAFGDGRWVMPDDLPWLARWQACRQVYRIDERVAAELATQDLDGDLPTDALRRMPYPILYIDCRVPVSYQTSTRWAHGFFAYIDRDARGELDLAIVYIMEDGTRSRLSLIIEDGTTLESCLQHIEDIDREMAEISEGQSSRRLTATLMQRRGCVIAQPSRSTLCYSSCLPRTAPRSSTPRQRRQRGKRSVSARIPKLSVCLVLSSAAPSAPPAGWDTPRPMGRASAPWLHTFVVPTGRASGPASARGEMTVGLAMNW